MSDLRLLVHLAGEAALLLWGLHMVQSGVERAFGGRLQALLGAALGSPLRAMGAGLCVTAALQSSTAAALMVEVRGCPWRLMRGGAFGRYYMDSR